MDDPFDCYFQPFDINEELSKARDKLTKLMMPFFLESNSKVIILTNYRKGTKLFEYVFSALDTSYGPFSNNPLIVSVERIKINGSVKGFILRPTKLGKYNPFSKYSGMVLSISDIESSREAFIQNVSLKGSKLVLFLDSVKSGGELGDILHLLSKLDSSAIDNIVSIIVYSAIPKTLREIADRWKLNQDVFKVVKEINYIDCYHVRDLQAIIGTAYEPWEEVLLPFSGIESNQFKGIVLDVLRKLYPNSDIYEFEDDLELFKLLGTNKEFTNWNVTVTISGQSDELDSFMLRFRFFKNRNGMLEKVDMLIENIDARLDYEPDPFHKKCPLLDHRKEIDLSPYCNNYLLLTQDFQVIQETICVQCLYYNFAKIVRYNIENVLTLYPQR